MTCATKTMSDRWRLKSPISARICRRHPVGKSRSRTIHNLAISLKLRKACGLDGIPNEFLRHFPGRPLIHLTHLFNYCLRLSNFSKSWKETKLITLPKHGKEPKLSQNIYLISLFPIRGKIFQKFILNVVQNRNEERGLIIASQFGVQVRHSTLQCKKLTDHVTLNLKNNYV
jgi:hypothetical protein